MMVTNTVIAILKANGLPKTFLYLVSFAARPCKGMLMNMIDCVGYADDEDLDYDDDDGCGCVGKKKNSKKLQ